ncbi:MAG: hypothetical protein JNM58_02200 [Xanthomonadaceae bacterium]|nr:hypothetical protein [Xanthomonadaceae bacterium]
MTAIVLHAEEEFDPALPRQTLASMLDDVRAAGFDALSLGLLHIGRDEETVIAGELRYNETLLFSEDRYLGPSGWLTSLGDAANRYGLRIALVFGGAGHHDFRAIRLLHARHGACFEGSGLRRNLLALRVAMPWLDSIELSCEDTYDHDSFVDFASLLVELGFDLALRPSMFRDFWVRAFAELHARHPGRVRRCHLQCHAKGSGNAPAEWARAFESAAPGFDANGFIIAAEWAENMPQEIRESLRGHAREACLGGGAIWSLERIIANGAEPASYADAIRAGLHDDDRRALIHA